MQTLASKNARRTLKYLILLIDHNSDTRDLIYERYSAKPFGALHLAVWWNAAEFLKEVFGIVGDTVTNPFRIDPNEDIGGHVRRS